MRLGRGPARLRMPHLQEPPHSPPGSSVSPCGRRRGGGGTGLWTALGPRLQPPLEPCTGNARTLHKPRYPDTGRSDLLAPPTAMETSLEAGWGGGGGSLSPLSSSDWETAEDPGLAAGTPWTEQGAPLEPTHPSSPLPVRLPQGPTLQSSSTPAPSPGGKLEVGGVCPHHSHVYHGDIRR